MLYKLLSLALMHFIGVISPGPDVLVIIRTGIKYGKFSAIKVVFGICLGLSFYAVISVFAMIFIAKYFYNFFIILHFIGALFLFSLVYKVLKSYFFSKKVLTENIKQDINNEFIENKRFFLLGFLTNILNPKAMIFFLSILPAFLSKDDTFLFKILLCIILVIIPLLWFLFLALITSKNKIRNFLLLRMNFVDYIFSFFVIILGFYLIYSGFLLI